MDAQRYVVIMAGGGGTRLWPHSRRSHPKQFLPLLPPDGETLLGATVRRLAGLLPLGNVFVVTTAQQVTEVRRCLPELPLANIIVEPIGRNTAPCIGLAAATILRRAPSGSEPTIAVLPADHYIQDEAALRRLLGQALEVAATGHVVTLGVRPTRPETGYGYIQLDDGGGEPGGEEGRSPLYRARLFVEKPDRERALAYVASGRHLWNSGMFFFRARRILDELRRNLPALGEILDKLDRQPELLPVLYPDAPSISIDYAVMEKLGADRVGPDAAIRVLSGDFGWSDVGSFAAIGELVGADAQGNRILGQELGSPAVLLHARDNVVWSSSRQAITAIGVEGLVIAVTEDAVLVVPQGRSQEVRELVAYLTSQGRSELL